VKYVIFSNNGLSYPKYLLSNSKLYSSYDLLFVDKDKLIRNVNIPRITEEINLFVSDSEISEKSKQIENRPKIVRNKSIPKKLDIYEVDKYSKKRKI
jgi:hypothetical protein